MVADGARGARLVHLDGICFACKRKHHDPKSDMTLLLVAVQLACKVKVNIDSYERCGVMVSEDDLSIVYGKSSIDGSTGKYAIAFDTLDESSNIDKNV